jgi:hypothetical protein
LAMIDEFFSLTSFSPGQIYWPDKSHGIGRT